MYIYDNTFIWHPSLSSYPDATHHTHLPRCCRFPHCSLRPATLTSARNAWLLKLAPARDARLLNPAPCCTPPSSPPTHTHRHVCPSRCHSPGGRLRWGNVVSGGDGAGAARGIRGGQGDGAPHGPPLGSGPPQPPCSATRAPPLVQPPSALCPHRSTAVPHQVGHSRAANAVFQVFQAFQTHVASLCFRCFRYMLQMFRIDVSKVNLSVTHIAMVIHVCFKCFIYFRRLLQMFHLNVSKVAIHACFKRFICFRLLLQMFHLNVSKLGFVLHILYVGC
jgi:hypothetical protein